MLMAPKVASPSKLYCKISLLRRSFTSLQLIASLRACCNVLFTALAVPFKQPITLIEETTAVQLLKYDAEIHLFLI